MNLENTKIYTTDEEVIRKYLRAFIYWDMRHVDFERAYYSVKECFH